MRASARAAAIARLTLTKKAYDVAVLDLRGLTTMADFFVVCSADSENQIRAVAEAVEEGMETLGERAWHREAGSPNWVLLDYVDVVLHIFHRDARTFYSLEKLWGDAVITPVSDENAEPDLEARAQARSAPVERPGKIRVQKAKAAGGTSLRGAGSRGAGTAAGSRGSAGGKNPGRPKGKKKGRGSTAGAGTAKRTRTPRAGRTP